MYLIGYIVKPQGVKGEIKILPVGSHPWRYKELDTVFVSDKNDSHSYAVKSIRTSEGCIYLCLEGISDRNQAEGMRNMEVYVSQENLAVTDADEYFIHDIVGCKVFSEDGTYIGVIREIVQMSSNDIYVIDTEQNEEKLIPAIKDIVKKIDIKLKRVEIHVIEGLLD